MKMGECDKKIKLGPCEESKTRPRKKRIKSK